MDATTNPARLSHQQFLDRLEAIRKSQEVLYRGYTIDKAEYGYEYYPTDEGRDDDADFDGESYRYCGNVRFASSINAAKREIDDLIYEKMHVVVLNEGKGIHEQRYEFKDFTTAFNFALQWSGNFYPNGQPIINP